MWFWHGILRLLGFPIVDTPADGWGSLDDDEPSTTPTQPAPKPFPDPGEGTEDPHWVYRPILELIGFTEGTDKGRGYNETLGYGAYTGGDVNLVGMTLSQIDSLQTKMLAHPKNKWNSSALGRYQIVRTTLRKIKAAMKLPGTTLFDSNTQDQMARYLLWGRGIDQFIAGKKSEDAMMVSLAQEWASWPKPNGKGYYGNQSHTPITPARVRAVLKEVKSRGNSR